MKIRVLKVRCAHEHELPEASRIIARSIRGTHKGILEDRYLDAMDDYAWLPTLRGNGFICLIITDDGVISGTALIREGEVPGIPGCGELSALYVDPDRLNQGLGTTLLNGALMQMLYDNLDTCVLNVFDNNFRAIKFYRRYGFELFGGTYQKMLNGKYYPMRHMRMRL